VTHKIFQAYYLVRWKRRDYSAEETVLREPSPAKGRLPREPEAQAQRAGTRNFYRDRLRLVNELASGLDRIYFLNCFITPNGFDSWKP
jgi:hypothetical protein